MSKNRNNKESMIWFTLKSRQNFFVYHIQSKENFLFFTGKELFKEEGEAWTKNETRATTIKKDRTMSIGKHVNEPRVREKTGKTAIKRDLSPNHNFLDYIIWGDLENNEASYPNIGSLKIAMEEE